MWKELSIEMAELLETQHQAWLDSLKKKTTSSAPSILVLAAGTLPYPTLPSLSLSPLSMMLANSVKES